jgi:hypothetical protein
MTQQNSSIHNRHGESAELLHIQFRTRIRKILSIINAPKESDELLHKQYTKRLSRIGPDTLDKGISRIIPYSFHTNNQPNYSILNSREQSQELLQTPKMRKRR